MWGNFSFKVADRNICDTLEEIAMQIILCGFFMLAGDRLRDFKPEESFSFFILRSS